VLREYARIASTDIAHDYDEGGNLLPVAKIPEGIRRALAGVEVNELSGDGEQIGSTKLLSHRKCRRWIR
jgi:hypothetical protein